MLLLLTVNFAVAVAVAVAVVGVVVTVGGRIAQWLAFLLLTKRPWVRILALDYSDVAKLINRSTLLREWTVELA